MSAELFSEMTEKTVFSGLQPDSEHALPISECVMVGMGLMGTSMVKAMKSAAKITVKGLDIHRDPIDKAIRDGVLADGAVLKEEDDHVREIIRSTRFIILALYPQGILPFIAAYRDELKKGTVIIDICGLKGPFVAGAQEMMPEGCEYVGCHPMAGKETSGYDNGNAEIFLGASFIITPTEKNAPETILAIRQIAGAIGCGKIREVTPDEHDRIIAYTSHLPHVMAVSLIRSWHGTDDITSYAGGSFRDGTRVAEINAGLWSQLLITNKKELSSIVDDYMKELEDFREILEKEDEEAMTEFLKEASARKTKWKHLGDRYNA